MNPVEIAIELARKIVAALKAVGEVGHAGPAEKFGLVEANAALRQAVEEAFERDRRNMWSWLGPVSLLSPAVLAAAHAAEAVGIAYREVCRAQLSEQATVLGEAETTVGKALPELEAAMERWSGISAEAIAKLPGAIDGLRQVPGWQGNAASGYGTMTRTQNSAAGQLSGATSTLPEALGEVITLNRGIMRALRFAVSNTETEVSSRRPSVPGAFECTISARQQIGRLQQAIDQNLKLETTRSAIAALDAKAEEARRQLPEPWPTA